MIPHAKRLSAAAAGLAIGATLIGCGDNVTGGHTWRSIVTETVHRVQQNSNSQILYDTLTGPLVDSNNRPVPGTLFRESCNRLYVGGVLKQDWNCLALVNTGQRVYVAGGHADGPIGELPTLADPRLGGALFIGLVGTTTLPPAPGPFTVQIVAVPGGGG
jgi:hypothetical protein